MSVEASQQSPADAAGTQLLPTHPDRTAALARLAAGIAHELRNPLAVVLARVQLLQLTLRSGKAIPPAKLEHALRAVEEQALRASKVIENLSGFARPRPPELALVDLPDLIARVLTLLKDRMPEADVRVEVDVRPDAEAMLADAGQLVTALSQLVLNGIEAMPAGGVLRVRVRRREGTIEISVADSGPGISQHDAPRIFDPFFSTKTSAAGLGLCVAQTIAESHGGCLRLDHAGTSGAEFVLVLPVRSLA